MQLSRRRFLLVPVASAAVCIHTRLRAADAAASSLRGKLQTGAKPVLNIPKGPVALQGDEPTMAVLGDIRLKDADFEVDGHLVSPGRMAVDPIHTRSLFVFKDGKRLMVTYWCPVCSIRTYQPGECWCCHNYTDLDPIEPDKP